MFETTIVHFAQIGRAKIDALHRSPLGFFVGAMLAGAYIGIAMILALSVAPAVPAAARGGVMGAVFGIGLILSLFAGGELFTGYAMYMGFGVMRKSVSLWEALMGLVASWLGNLVGALLLTAIFVAGGGGAIFANHADNLHLYAAHKVDADLVQLFARALLCNWLVCLAIWTAARVAGDAAKCIVIAWILTAFVAAGFEHSVANMTALSLGLLAPDPTITLIGALRNLGIVTIGNTLGALLFVVGAYGLAARADAPAAGAPKAAGGAVGKPAQNRRLQPAKK